MPGGRWTIAFWRCSGFEHEKPSAHPDIRNATIQLWSFQDNLIDKPPHAVCKIGCAKMQQMHITTSCHTANRCIHIPVDTNMYIVDANNDLFRG